jgi:hypothetical protein
LIPFERIKIRSTMFGEGVSMPRTLLATSATAQEVLDREFLALRSKILELAAALDRIDRASGSAAGDPRTELIQRSLKTLLAPGARRAGDIQMIFSLPYDPRWRAKQGP